MIQIKPFLLQLINIRKKLNMKIKIYIELKKKIEGLMCLAIF